ncbi:MULTISPECIES: hypothetical protein [Streptomyces]|uniref:Secreted protein n=1 Tax=Streptomyces sudanensis TaxID=436397 RepID=A0ABY4TEV3_9ACTN|nr:MULTISPECIES: hypothetical protein [Streptomyces]MCP9958458.1 hypothetical protein [Streptomyces sudanensis]MCQ0001028.1 hypothetical protein [Streptomyces sudanensis]URN16619.1 hypothetical protein MW084_12470 [Streptomyces sudanensis]
MASFTVWPTVVPATSFTCSALCTSAVFATGSRASGATMAVRTVVGLEAEVSLESSTVSGTSMPSRAADTSATSLDE